MHMKKNIYVLAVCVGAALCTFIRPAMATEAVPNGSFEDLEDTLWECDTNCTLPVNFYFALGGSTASDGYYYLYIFNEVGVYQDLTLPADALSLTFQYDNQPGEAVDEEGAFTVWLLNPDSGEILTQQSYSEQSDTWLTGTLNIPVELQGQVVRAYITNDTGYNRIDALEFSTEADVEATHAVVRLHVLSNQGKAVKDATVYVKKDGERLMLTDLNTNEEVTKVTTNKKGKTHKFEIVYDVTGGESMKLCVKKSGIKECASISPEANVETTYDFTFSSKKVTATGR